MYPCPRTILIATIASLAAAVATADSGNGNGTGQQKMLGKGNPFTIEDLPPGRTRERLLSLPEPARRQALEWLHRFDFPVNDIESLAIDDEGGILYVDSVPPGLAVEEAESPTGDGVSEPGAVSAAADAFFLHSRAGAPHVVYLDFDGHTFSQTAWSSGSIQARPFDLDGSPGTFNDAERDAIAEIWHRVAEDFAPFDIDVTTEEPASFDRYTGRILITSRTDANGGAMPYDSAGGVAYVGVWGADNYASYYSPALVYYDNLASGTTYIAEASSHEFGHNLGLSHDGADGVTYYAGHGGGAVSWAPIMGNSYYNNVTQWSKGEYVGANNTQDDIAIITSRLDLVGDDHSDGLQGATPLLVDAGGQINASNPETDPHNSFRENKGRIEASGDQDLFRFSAAAGQIDLTVTPAWDAYYRTSKRGANLDVRAALLDANGVVLATSDPLSDTHAIVSTSVPGGIYYLSVTAVGSDNYSDYASVGQYFISGSVIPGEVVDLPPIADFGFACMGLDCSFSDGSADGDGAIVSWAWDFGDGSASSEQSPNHAYADFGTFTVGLTVTDNDGLVDSVSKNVTVTAPNLPPAADFSVACTDLSCDFTDNSSDSDGEVTDWSWDFGDGATAASRNASHDYANAGTYSVALTVTDNQGGNATSTRSLTVTAATDTEPPVVTITSPGDDTDISGKVTLSAIATDNQQVSSIAIYADGKLRCSGVSSTSCTWNLRKVASGVYGITAEATDAAGNLGSAFVTVNVTDDGAKGNKGKGGGGSAGKAKGPK